MALRPASHDRPTLWLTAGLALALALVSVPAHAQSCIPATTPCQTCPEPPPCPPPTDTSCIPGGGGGIGGGGGNTTFTTSTVTCTGAFDQTTVTSTVALGPGNICIGPNKSVGAFVCPGTTNINTNTDTITASLVAIPTLSVWAFGALAVGLGVLALRRLRAFRPTQG